MLVASAVMTPRAAPRLTAAERLPSMTRARASYGLHRALRLQNVVSITGQQSPLHQHLSGNVGSDGANLAQPQGQVAVAFGGSGKGGSSIPESVGVQISQFADTDQDSQRAVGGRQNDRLTHLAFKTCRFERDAVQPMFAGVVTVPGDEVANDGRVRGRPWSRTSPKPTSPSEGTGSKSVKPVKTLMERSYPCRDQAADQDTHDPSCTLTGSPPATR